MTNDKKSDTAANMRQRAMMVAEIDELARHFRGTVRDIEASTPTTRDHYGDYMSAISSLVGQLPADADHARRCRFIALVLLKAGASEPGVVAAMTALGVE